MRYYINGDEVSEKVFDRDADDNFNAGIPYNITEEKDATYMLYETICEACQ